MDYRKCCRNLLRPDVNGVRGNLRADEETESMAHAMKRNTRMPW